MFEIGGHYENLKGVYEVLSIQGDSVRIRWEDTGEEIDTSQRQQGKILKFIEKERQEAAAKKKRGMSTSGYGSLFAGMAETDFREGTAGTRWRSREQLGGAVTRLLDAKGFAFQSWGISRMQEIHWADVSVRGTDESWYQAKFCVAVGPEDMTFGFYIERPETSNQPRDDWDRFLSYLGNVENEQAALFAARENGLVWKEWRGRFPEVFSEISPAEADNTWKLKRKGAANAHPIPFLQEFFAKLPQDEWLDLILAKTFKKEEALARGVEIAADIAGVFTDLMSLYAAAIGREADLRHG